MSERNMDVAAIGADAAVGGFALAGARVYAADSADQVRQAWEALPQTVTFVVLSQAAADILGDDRNDPSAPLTVVLPE